ncbi:MAG: hypothetical protein ACRC1H_15730, partial [Caldilineaceae bacterium]
MELYSSFLKLAPLLLLKLLSARGLGRSNQGTGGHARVAFASDLAVMVAAIGGAFVALFVLGDVLAPTAITRWLLVVGGCLSLLALGEYQVRRIVSMYRSRPRARRVLGASSETADHPR